MRAINKHTVVLAATGIGIGLAATQLLFTGRKKSKLQGGVVLITGGSRGLGLSLAREFASRGCRVAICARDSGELDRAARDLERRGADVMTFACDVSDRAQVERFIDAALRRYGRIDVLVNNAGVIQVGPVENMTLDDFHEAMNVMFWGTVYPTMSALPHMIERKAGRIVNITSIGGKVSVPHLLPYNCAKFAAVGFSEGLRAELGKHGIKVVTIAPGLMRTGSYLNAYFKGDQEKESKWFGISASMPLLTMSGSRAASQIADATERGDAEKILTAPANVLSRFHGLFPGMTADMLGLVASLILPAAAGGKGRKKGRETRALRKPVMAGLTLLGRLAAKRFLQQPRGAAA